MIKSCTYIASSVVAAHEDEVFCLSAFESVRLATGSKDKTIKIWDVNASKLSLCLTEHDYHVKALAYGAGNLFGGSKFVAPEWISTV